MKKLLNITQGKLLLAKFAVIFIGIWLFTFYGCINAEGADWRYFYFSRDQKITYYFDRESITSSPSKNVRVWIKNVDENGDYKKCHVELNCKDKMYTFLAIISYTKEDRIQYGSSYLANWESFAPGSIFNFLSTIICP